MVKLVDVEEMNYFASNGEGEVRAENICFRKGREMMVALLSYSFLFLMDCWFFFVTFLIVVSSFLVFGTFPGLYQG